MRGPAVIWRARWPVFILRTRCERKADGKSLPQAAAGIWLPPVSQLIDFGARGPPHGGREAGGATRGPKDGRGQGGTYVLAYSLRQLVKLS